MGRAFTRAIAVAALVFAACGYRTAYEHQQRAMNRMRPAPLVPSRHAKPRGVLRVRAWADADYRAATPRWKERVRGEIEAANAYLSAELGVRLEVEVRAWDREGGGADLEDALVELEQRDPADDVDFVMGFVGTLPIAEATFHKIGLARSPGRHFVVRGMNDVAEARAIDEAFPTVEAADRRAVYVERRTHKELLVLLHEWAHTLGAIHTHDPGSILGFRYDPRLAGFDRPNRRILEIALRWRIARRTDPEASARLAAELLAFVEQNDEAGWEDQERGRLIAALRSGRTGIHDARVRRQVELSDLDRENLAESALRARQGKWADAWRFIAEVAEHHPEAVDVQLAACKLAAHAEAPAAEARAACRRAADLAPADVEALLVLGDACLTLGDEAAAWPALAEARARLLRHAPGGGAGWNALVALYVGHNAVTFAEEAAAASGDEALAAGTRAWAEPTRRRSGLPPDAARFGITAELEPEYERAFWRGWDNVLANQLAPAEEEGRAAAKRFPGAPGPLTVLCSVDVMRGRYQPARKRCAQAIAAWDETSFAHFMAGMVAWAQRKPKEAIARFERAIELDPEITNAWDALARLYEETGDEAGLEDLRARWRRRGGR